MSHDMITYPVGTGNEEARHRWVREALKRVPAGSRLLDAGAGTQRYRPDCAHLRYVSQDFAQYNGAGDGVGLQTGTFDYGKLDLVCDITRVPEADGSFDAILCTEVLEHVPQPDRALQELGRLLRPDGYLILTAPFTSFTHFAPYHYCTGFNQYFFEDALPRAGFDRIQIERSGGFFDVVAQELRRASPMAARYSGTGPKVLDRFGFWLAARALERFKKTDRGSAEFGCYGLHVFARRAR